MTIIPAIFIATLRLKLSKEASYIEAVSNMRFDYSLSGNYLVNGCCFHSISIQSSVGGAISIGCKSSTLAVYSSSFIQCISETGGAIYFGGRFIQVSGVRAMNCSLCSPMGSGAFFYAEHKNISVSANKTSVYECPGARGTSGYSTMQISSDILETLSSNYSAVSISNLNNTYNFNIYGRGCALSIDGIESISIQSSVFLSCFSYNGKSIIAFENSATLEVDTASFANNSVSPDEIVMFLISYVDSSEFFRCLFADFDGSNAFKIVDSKDIILKECCIMNFGLINGSIITINVSKEYKDANDIWSESLMLCTRLPIKTYIAAFNGATVAGIAIGVGLAVIGIAAYVSYRLYSKNRIAAQRLRDYELTESISNEFG